MCALTGKILATAVLKSAAASGNVPIAPPPTVEISSTSEIW
ncbi:hypothetical protein VV11_012995 [Trichodesmium erythraeum 21-75]|nr:hypothetical protein [Trichodesmium erythraeum 21-75]